MGIFLILLQLVPVITNGIFKLHADKGAGHNTAMAHDSLDLVLAGAKAAAPSHSDLITALGSVAHSDIDSSVAALHANA
jgi:hypothetical protein